ncbi:MAG TPA: hypothetical protein VGG03_19285 [Thermoanaerobaculia bacterium]
MNDERDPKSGKAATAELEHETKHHHEQSTTGASGRQGEHAAAETPRHTTAGLGMYERVSSVAGTGGFGIAPGLGAATPPVRTVVTQPGITGVARDYTAGEPGTTHETRFTEEEDAYWRQNYPSRPYALSGRNYDEYRPAYHYGTDAAHRYQGRPWEDVESDLERGWESAKGNSRLAWHETKDAVRDAWHRVERALPGDADRDGR